MGNHWRNGFHARVVTSVAAALIMFSLVTVAVAAGADEAGAASPKIDDQWHLQATFSFWATSMDGSLGVDDQSADFDECFSDLIQHANYAFNPGAELTKGNWLLAFYMTYSKLSADETAPDGSDLDAETTLGAWSLLLGNTIVRKQLDNGMTLSLTPAIGAQITSMDNKINPEFLQSREQTVTFVDPIIAGRVVLGLTPKLDWRTEGMIGGFGVGSNLTWSAGSYLDWNFSEHLALNFGYRALSWDYDLGAVDTNLLIHGPWIGLTWKMF